MRTLLITNILLDIATYAAIMRPTLQDAYVSASARATGARVWVVGVVRTYPVCIDFTRLFTCSIICQQEEKLAHSQGLPWGTPAPGTPRDSTDRVSFHQYDRRPKQGTVVDLPLS